MRRMLPALLVAGPIALALAAGPAPAGAAVRGCPISTTVEGVLSQYATVSSVRNMSCRGALGFVRRYGRSARFAASGSTFALGPFRCVVVGQGEEDTRARCTSGTHAFRFDFGA